MKNKTHNAPVIEGVIPPYRLLHTGEQGLIGMLAAIQEARKSVRLEVYILREDGVGARFIAALLAATQRGVQVQVMLDAGGSSELNDSFLEPVIAKGGKVKFFNPLTLSRFSVRDHRKILILDDALAYVTGFNLGQEYDGDGVSIGWRDIGLELRGTEVSQLVSSYERMWQLADLKQGALAQFKRFVPRPMHRHQRVTVLFGGPGRNPHPIRRSLASDFKNAKHIRIYAGYFLPTWQLRRILHRRARAGAKVQVILPAKSDVPLAQLATQHLYSKLCRFGIEVYEYQPQILHAKMVIADDAVYTGSANFDVRSLLINYEVMIRIEDQEFAAEANAMFEQDLKASKRIDLVEWRKSRSFWQKLKSQFAYSILSRLDPWLARYQWQNRH